MSLLTDKAASTGTTHTDPSSLVSGAVVPDESRGARTTSFDVADFPMPHGREEDWRFTPIDRLTSLLSDEPSDERAGDPPATFDVQVPDSVHVGTLAPGEAPRGTALVPADRAAVVASAQVEEALHLRLDPEQEYAEPLRLSVHGAGAGRRSNAHYVVEARHHSKALLIIDHTGSGDHNANLEVVVGDGADLTVVTLQRWDDDAKHLGQHEALVQGSGQYRHIAVTLGGSIVRINTNVRYSGSGGDATLLGVYYADEGQHLEHRSFVDHNAPHCRSLVTYKGALQGESAHTVWIGDVLIRADADDTDTYELNRNLVLTDGARADSVPNLEIETGEIVGAGHASSTGRFDDEQLFYLQARGIPELEARKLVVRGFFADVIAKIGVPEVIDMLMEAIDAELAEVGQ